VTTPYLIPVDDIPNQRSVRKLPDPPNERGMVKSVTTAQYQELVSSFEDSENTRMEVAYDTSALSVRAIQQGLNHARIGVRHPHVRVLTRGSRVFLVKNGRIAELTAYDEGLTAALVAGADDCGGA
jgi:hypothetical protein